MCNYSSFVWRNTWQHLINRCCHILACLKCCCKIYRPNIWNNDRLFRECNGSLGEYFSFTEVVITSVCWRKNSVPRKRKLYLSANGRCLQETFELAILRGRPFVTSNNDKKTPNRRTQSQNARTRNNSKWF